MHTCTCACLHVHKVRWSGIILHVLFHLLDLLDAEFSPEGCWWGGGNHREWREGETIQTLCCHHQNYVCIKMGSDESHLHASVTVRGKVIRQSP